MFEGKTIYAHPSYHTKDFKVQANQGEHKKDYPFEVLREEEVHARFKTLAKAEKYVAFMHGGTNKL